ncbi:retrovirus-related Pol polyprotein from transposon opus, partial [Nephila pilipes]
LGLDFLEKYNFILDFKDSSLHSTTEDVTLYRKGVSEMKPCYRIIASSDFTIPARQELILKGHTDQVKNFRLGVLEFPDFENFPKGVLVASTLVDITKEAIPVRCANVSDKPKISKKVKVSATCNPVICVERSSFQTSNVSSENLTEDFLKTTELTQKQRSATDKMLREFKELFPKSSEEFGRTNLTKHRIDTGNHPPIKQHPRRLPFAKVKEVEMDPVDREKTAFSTSGQRLWQFKVMPFGLCNAPANFEHLMETVLRGLSPEACLIYLDDIIIVGRDFEEQLNNLRKVLEKLKQPNLKLNSAKSHLFRREVSYLGHIISAKGIRTDPRKVAAVKE